VRLIVTSVLTVLIGVLSSVYAAEIMTSTGVDWSTSFKKVSFWLLTAAVVIWLVVQIAYMRNDKKVLAFADDNYCLAHIRKTKLEAFAKQVKDNPESANLIKANTFLKELGVSKK